MHQSNNLVGQSVAGVLQFSDLLHIFLGIFPGFKHLLELLSYLGGVLSTLFKKSEDLLCREVKKI